MSPFESDGVNMAPMAPTHETMCFTARLEHHIGPTLFTATASLILSGEDVKRWFVLPLRKR